MSSGCLSHQLPFKTCHIHLLTNLSSVYVNTVFCTIQPAGITRSKQEQRSCHREGRERGGESRAQRPGRAARTQRRGLMLALQVITAIRTKPAKLLLIPFLFVLGVLFQALPVPLPSLLCETGWSGAQPPETTGEAAKRWPELAGRFWL